MPQYAPIAQNWPLTFSNQATANAASTCSMPAFLTVPSRSGTSRTLLIGENRPTSDKRRQQRILANPPVHARRPFEGTSEACGTRKRRESGAEASALK